MPVGELVKLARLHEDAGRPEDALAAYVAALREAPGLRGAMMLVPRLAELESQLAPARDVEVRIALLGNATLDQLRDCLAAECYREGWRPRTYLAGFDQYAQEILDEGSGLYAFEPGVLVLALHASRLFPVLHDDPFALSISERKDAIAAGVQTVRGLLTQFRRRSNAQVLLHNMVAPQRPASGILDSRDPFGQTAIFAEINAQLAGMARSEFENVHVVDVDRVEARVGKSRATDVRLWLAARLPWTEPMLLELTAEHMRYLRAIRGATRKCLILDLDGTLWGGVVGEDGITGIRLGAEAPGSAFVLFQREILKLWERGVLIAVCSKNNSNEALEVIRRHPAMVLREQHIAAHRIGWNSKPESIREIATELNIGLDSLVFLDDNPVERAAVKATLPEVLCPDMPADPALYRQTLNELGVFDALALTDEDRRRNAMYAQQRQREELRTQHGGVSLAEYLTDLGTEVEVAAADSSSLPRLAQLTQKTNQFNLTTRRYTETEIRALAESDGLVYRMRVSDRFGDNGVVGLAIALPRSSDTWEIDVLLLSCRVIGRGVESALLARLADGVSARGGARLRGWFLPTEKNAPAKECYRECGFSLLQTTPDGGQLWELDLRTASIPVPAWIRFNAVALAAAQ